MSAKFWHRLSSECALWEKGTTLVAGADEAGCGPLAGPVVAAAVVFPCSWLQGGLYKKLRGLNDSKQLTEEQREAIKTNITVEFIDPRLSIEKSSLEHAFSIEIIVLTKFMCVNELLLPGKISDKLRGYVLNRCSTEQSRGPSSYDHLCDIEAISAILNSLFNPKIEKRDN